VFLLYEQGIDGFVPPTLEVTRGLTNWRSYTRRRKYALFWAIFQVL